MSTISTQDIGIVTDGVVTGKVKLEALRSILLELESVAVAYSGGVDSAFLLYVAHEVLGSAAAAVTALSPSYPSDDIKSAKEVAARIGARHVILYTHEVEDPRYLENTTARCYFCKVEMYASLGAFARANGLKYIVDGLNEDDLTDRRPGRQAALELGVRSPLAQVHLRKEEIRALSRQVGLPTWDKPAMACLSSRVPYGTPITPAALTLIDKAETFLHGLGIHQVRVRHHQDMARLEVEPGDLVRVVENRVVILEKLKALGYKVVALDLEGYRPGSMQGLVSKTWSH